MTRRCLYCGESLKGGRRKYCSDDHADRYYQEVVAPLTWANARAMALERAGYRCEECGATDALDVHHLRPLPKGEPRHNSAYNAQHNLIVLCHQHHWQVHHPPLSYLSHWPQAVGLQLRLRC